MRDRSLLWKVWTVKKKPVVPSLNGRRGTTMDILPRSQSKRTRTPLLIRLAAVSRAVLARLPKTRRPYMIAALCCALALAAVTGIRMIRHDHGGAGTGRVPTQLQHGTPDYDTLLPTGKDINDLGGWTRVSPPESAPVFAYVDTVGNVQVNISQQPLPEELRKNTDEQVYQMARNFGATEKITVGDASVYIGTSTKGPQSVIFTRHGLLVLIKSAAPLTTEQWAEYVGHLR